jgi:hypothetical protein
MAANNVVNIATSLRAGRYGVLMLAEAKDFVLARTSRRSLGLIHPPIKLVPVLFPGGKAPGSEVDHSPPISAEVKNEWSYTSTPPPILQKQ